MKKMAIMVSMVLLLVGTISYAVMAGNQKVPGQDGEIKKSEPGLPKPNLKLTDEQKIQMITIRQQFAKDTVDLKFDMQKKEMELKKLWKAKPLDRESIESTTQEMVDIKIQWITKFDAMREKMRAVLTPEQQKMLDEKREKRGERKMGFFGPDAPGQLKGEGQQPDGPQKGGPGGSCGECRETN